MTLWSSLSDVCGNVGSRPWSLEKRQEALYERQFTSVIAGERWSGKKFEHSQNVLTDTSVLQRLILNGQRMSRPESHGVTPPLR